MSANENNERAKLDSRWDKRTWIIAVSSSALFIFLTWFGRFTPFENAVSSRIPIYLWGDDAGGLLSDGAALTTLFILPFVLTLIARRRAFLWGAFPILAAAFADLTHDYFSHASQFTVRQELYGSWFVIPAWFVLSGLGVLIRALVRRRKLRRVAVIEARSAAPDIAGIWPPAPSDERTTNSQP